MTCALSALFVLAVAVIAWCEIRDAGRSGLYDHPPMASGYSKKKKKGKKKKGKKKK